MERTGASEVTIRDYKTGRARDIDGSVRPHIALQLRLYGLAASELLPGHTFRLVVSDGMEQEVSFTAEDADRTRRWLDGVLTTLPAGAQVSPDTLASPGMGCRNCPFRPGCTAYVQEAPELWASGTIGFSLPLDTWGTVSEVEVDPQGLTTVHLRDAADRLVRATRLLPRALVHDVSIGMPIWFFGLEAGARPTVGDRSFHPRNFHELARTSLERRAWALAIFR